MFRNRFVDVLKGIFIIFVLITHTWIEPSTRNLFGFPFWVDMAVPVFMLISGYVSAYSIERNGDAAIEKAYETRQIIRKVLRFVIPFSMAFVAEWIVLRCFGIYTVGIKEYGIFAFLLYFLRGGAGQGSYYFPLMIQFIFLFPIIYYFIKKYELKGLIGCFCVNGLYEVIKIAYGMTDYEYRLLVFRYLFIIAAGCYIAIGNWQKISIGKRIVSSSICVVIGLGFIYLFSYTQYVPKVITFWSTTSFLVCLYLVPIFGILLTKVRFGFKPLELVGKAAFNILLVQKIYYIFLEKTYEIIPNVCVHLIVSIVNCVAVGVIFYLLESKLTKYILEKKHNK